MEDICNKLRSPVGVLHFPCDVERLENGNTLIADAGAENGSGSEVLEVDTDGNVVWQYGDGLKFAHSAKRMANGNTLIADTTNDRVIEVTKEGELVFSSDQWADNTGKLSDGSFLCYPNDAHPLEDGTIFLTDRNNDRCLRVDREGNVLFSYTGSLKHPHNCDLQPDGSVLIANSDENNVLLVDPDGKVIWKYENPEDPLSWPRDADRTAEGNVLITDSKNARVLEVDTEGNLIWQYKADHFSNYYDSDRLANGNTLISDQQHHQVIEVDRSGKIVWKFRNYKPLSEPNDRLINTSFKKIDADNMPQSWILATRLSEGGGKIIWTENEKGKKCPGIEYDRSGALCLQQTIKAEAGACYNVSAKIKTEDVESIACIQLAFLDEFGGLVQDVIDAPKGTLFTGTNDWTMDSFVADAPEGSVACEIRLFINGPGKVWVNNINVFC